MKNSYFIFPTMDYASTYTFSDIFETNKRGVLSDAFISDNELAFYYIILRDNVTLDEIAYQEYERSDYWDLLFKVNQLTSPFDLPKSIDYILNMVDEEMLIWKAKFPKLGSVLLAEKEAELTEKYTNLNEKYRRFRCVNTSHISLLFQALNNE